MRAKGYELLLAVTLITTKPPPFWNSPDEKENNKVGFNGQQRLTGKLLLPSSGEGVNLFIATIKAYWGLYLSPCNSLRPFGRKELQGDPLVQ